MRDERITYKVITRRTCVAALKYNEVGVSSEMASVASHACHAPGVQTLYEALISMRLHGRRSFGGLANIDEGTFSNELLPKSEASIRTSISFLEQRKSLLQYELQDHKMALNQEYTQTFGSCASHKLCGIQQSSFRQSVCPARHP